MVFMLNPILKIWSSVVHGFESHPSHFFKTDSRSVVVNHSGLWSRTRRFESAREYLYPFILNYVPKNRHTTIKSTNIPLKDSRIVTYKWL